MVSLAQMLGMLAGVIVFHIFHLILHRRVYAEDEDIRNLVR
jgi:hypothetical protein